MTESDMTAGPTRVVGREQELATLARALGSLGEGASAAVALVGEGGLGKTRLLDEVLGGRMTEGLTVIRGRAAEFEGQVPFALVIDALTPWIDPADLDWLTTTRDTRLHEMGSDMPASPLPLAAPADRLRARHSMRALLQDVDGDGPLAIAFDDVQWADEASLELIAHLLSRPLDRPTLLVLSYRSPGEPPLLSGAVEAALRANAIDRIELGPLSREQADDLIRDGIDSANRDAAYEATGGNPFFLEQLMRAHAELGRHPAPEIGDDHGCIVPPAVRASLAQDLARLTPRARTLLEAMAVAGGRVAVDVAAQIGELPDADARDAIDELIAAGFLRPADPVRTFEFRHPIVARAVYASAGDGWRLGAHERAAATLMAAGAPALVVARHVERSAHVGDETAIELLTEAGRSAGPASPATAARCLSAALRLLPEGDTARRLDLLVALAHARVRAGQVAEGREVLADALGLLGPDDSDTRFAVVTLLAQTEVLTGRDEDVRRLLDEALAAAPTDEPCERAALLLEIAASCLRGGMLDEATRRAHASLVPAREAGDAALHAAAAGLLGLTECYSGAIEAGREHVGEAAKLVASLSNAQLGRRLGTTLYIAGAEAALGRHTAAIEHGERGLAVAAATGQELLVVPLGIVVCWSQLQLGRLDEAAATAAATVDGARSLGLDQPRTWASVLAAAIAMQRGDGGAGVAVVKAVGSAIVEAPPGPHSSVTAYLMSRVQSASGDGAGARETLLRFGGGDDLPNVEHALAPSRYATLTLIELGLGDVPAARRWVDRGAAIADGVDIPWQKGHVERALALVLLGEGKPGEAAGRARSAIDYFAEQSMPLAVASSRIALGQALAAAGDRDTAAAELERAYRDLDAHGAVRWRDEAARELRALARRVPRPGRRASPDADGIDALSDREREVADLLAEGMTNKQIGAALFLSERTVEKHVSRVFVKLGVGSRAEAAASIAASRVGAR